MRLVNRLGVICFVLALCALPSAVFAQGQVPFRAPTSLPLWLGLVILGTIMIAFAILGWWLYLSPLREAAPIIDNSPGAIRTRRIIGGLACVAGLSLAVALVWDEMWHRMFGGFGNDFLWPPHLLMYGSFLLDAVFAAFGLSLTFRRHTGGIRRRFRSEPAMSLLGLISLYEVVSLPSDQVWHAIYGVDITAWSLPHLFIFGTAALMFLMACALLLSGTQESGWQSIRNLARRDLPLILLVSLANWVALMVGVVEYEWNMNPAARHMSAADVRFLEGRPGWAYPIVVLIIGVIMSHFVLHIIRKPGVATLSALLVLAGRLLQVAVGSAVLPPGPMVISHAALVVLAVVLDLWYAWRMKDADSRITLFGGIAVYWAVFVAVVLPLIADRQAGPEPSSGDMVATAVIGAIAALIFGVGASALGNWLRHADSPRKPVAAPLQMEHSASNAGD